MNNKIIEHYLLFLKRDLSMSNEEKVLRINYGANVDNFINSGLGHARHSSAQLGLRNRNMLKS